MRPKEVTMWFAFRDFLSAAVPLKGKRIRQAEAFGYKGYETEELAKENPNDVVFSDRFYVSHLIQEARQEAQQKYQVRPRTSREVYGPTKTYSA